MGFVEAIKSFYRRYFDFETRSTRSEYWWFFLYKMIMYVVLMIPMIVVFAVAGGEEPSDAAFGLSVIPFALFYLVNIIPSIAVAVRRFHDQDQSGWMYLLRIIPYVGGLILIVFMILEGTRGPNRFGPNPLDGGVGGTFE